MTKAEKKIWEQRLLQKVETVHKKNRVLIAKKLLRKSQSAKYSMELRSKKQKVLCNIILEDLVQILHDNYGAECRYCKRKLVITNMVFDHIIPISRGGESTKSNTQIICRTCNNIKGSLAEDDLKLLLDWLETIPPDLKKDIRIRLAGGIH